MTWDCCDDALRDLDQDEDSLDAETAELERRRLLAALALFAVVLCVLVVWRQTPPVQVPVPVQAAVALELDLGQTGASEAAFEATLALTATISLEPGLALVAGNADDFHVSLELAGW